MFGAVITRQYEKRYDIIVVDECMRAMLGCLNWVQQGDCLREEIFMEKASRCMDDDRAAEEIEHVSGTHHYVC